MKKMTAILAVLIAAVMVMGMTASAEAWTWTVSGKYDYPQIRSLSNGNSKAAMNRICPGQSWDLFHIIEILVR